MVRLRYGPKKASTVSQLRELISLHEEEPSMILSERSGHKTQTGFLSAMVVQVYVLVILPLLVQGHPIHFHCHEAAPDAQASCDKRVSACYGRVSSLTPCKFSAYGLPTELDELLYTGNSFQAVDWDGDGDLDLLVATPQGSILQYERVANDLLIRNYNATQFHRIEIPKSNFKVHAQDVLGWIGPKFQGIDWDNDGDLDLLAINRDHTLSFWENVEGELIQDISRANSFQNLTDIYALQALDWDADDRFGPLAWHTFRLLCRQSRTRRAACGPTVSTAARSWRSLPGNSRQVLGIFPGCWLGWWFRYRLAPVLNGLVV